MKNCKTCKHKEHLDLHKDLDTGESHFCRILSCLESVDFKDMMIGGYAITEKDNDEFFKVSFVLDACPAYEAE